jgi:uncharacterized alpha-E superfamily protein
MNGMISRVAEHCFWLGRYIERAENTSRLLQATRGLVLDTELTPQECWRPLIVAAGEEIPFVRLFGEGATGDAETVERYMTWDERNLSSLVASVRAGRENVRSVREVVSLDAWEVVNEIHLWLGSDAARVEFATHRYGFHRRIRDSVQLCLGLMRSTMLHDTPLEFIWLGVMLERAGQVARLLDVHHPSGRHAAERHPIIETSVWLSLLRAASALEPFLQRHHGRVTPQAAASFLMLEPRLPRSLRYCIHAAHERLTRIRPSGDATLPGAASMVRLGALDRWITELSAVSLEPSEIHDHLTKVVDEVAMVCNTVGAEFFGAPEEPAAPEAVPQTAA